VRTGIFIISVLKRNIGKYLKMKVMSYIRDLGMQEIAHLIFDQVKNCRTCI